ncbi:MAG: hypothetical protein LLG04_02710 [Parachlamydia sp.]|nr:hypothetical protein [Parachlamydia sp.]
MQSVQFASFKGAPQKVEAKKSAALSRISKRVFDGCEHVWSYLGKLFMLTRHALNITVKTCQRVAMCCSLNRRILNAVTRLKLFSIVSVPFSIFTVHSTGQKLFKSFHLRDKEGVALASLSLALISTDIVDSLATFTNAALATLSKAPVALFSTIGMPIAYALIGMGSASRTIQLVKTYCLFKKFQGQVLTQNMGKRRALEQFLEAKLGVTPEEKQLMEGKADKSGELLRLKEKKRAALLRAAPSEVVQEFEKIADLLKGQKTLTEREAAALLRSLDKISHLLKKKMVVDAGNLLANIISFIAITLFFFTVPPVVPFIFLAASMIQKISTLAYQDLS